MSVCRKQRIPVAAVEMMIAIASDGMMTVHGLHYDFNANTSITVTADVSMGG